MRATAIGAVPMPAPERARTLVACAGAVWIWPGILLAVRQGSAIVPANTETIRFWITRLHGPEALDKDILAAVSCAARRLTLGDETGAQRALDALRFTELSRDGALLMRAVTDQLDIEPLDLPLRAGPRTWAARDVAVHLPLFRRHVEVGWLVKGVIPFDESKHPRWPAGAPQSQGGRFAPAGASDASVIPVAARRRYPKRRPPVDDLTTPSSEPARGIGDNSDQYQELPELPEDEPSPDERYGVVQEIAQTLQEALAAGAVQWIQNYLQGLATILWLRNATTNYYYYQLKADLDPPKTLQELQDAVATPTLGYHVHHIVELQPGLDDGLPEDLLNSPNFYDATPITVWDQNAIELYGLRIASTVTAHEVCDSGIAQTAAQLVLQRGLYIRNHYQFKLSWEYCLLEPMDLVTLTDANLGLSNVAVRITEIEEDDQGVLSVTAEEFPAGVATSAAYPVQQPAGGGFATNASPGSVNAPIIFEPPSALVGEPEIWIAASGGTAGVANPYWGGAYVWVSLDGTTYAQIGTLIGPARQGALSASLPTFAGTNPDTTDTLAVNMAESAGVLATATALDAQLANTLCIVDGELVSYETSTLTSANNYALTTLYRGLYGTAPAAHSSGAPFARLDDVIFKYALPAQYVGTPLSIKLQSFNVFGAGLQELSACTAYSYTPSGVAVDHSVAEEILASGGSWDFGLVTESVGADDDFGSSLTLWVELDVDFGAV